MKVKLFADNDHLKMCCIGCLWLTVLNLLTASLQAEVNAWLKRNAPLVVHQ